MDITNEEMIKSLTSLIDETLEEIEEIKKSKFAAAECSLGDSESGMDSKSKNGELDAKKADKDDDEDEDDEDKKEKDMDKGENEKADEDAGKFAQAPTVTKGENEKADEDAGKFAQAPTVSKKEEKDEEKDDKEKDEKEDGKEMKKSLEASETLMKSYVDEKLSTFTDTLSKMQEAIEAIADKPVERKGIPAGVTPLQKSIEEPEPLNKSDIADALFELKKSGQEVDSADIFSVETAENPSTVLEIANKYGLKSKGDIR